MRCCSHLVSSTCLSKEPHILSKQPWTLTLAHAQHRFQKKTHSFTRCLNTSTICSITSPSLPPTPHSSSCNTIRHNLPPSTCTPPPSSSLWPSLPPFSSFPPYSLSPCSPPLASSIFSPPCTPQQVPLVMCAPLVSAHSIRRVVIKESWHLHWEVMARTWRSHGRFDESESTREGVMAHTLKRHGRLDAKEPAPWSHGTHMTESHHTYECVMSRVWISHVTQMHESWYTHRTYKSFVRHSYGVAAISRLLKILFDRISPVL